MATNRAPQTSYAARAVFVALAENLRPVLVMELSGRGFEAILPTGAPVERELYERIMGYEGQEQSLVQAVCRLS